MKDTIAKAEQLRETLLDIAALLDDLIAQAPEKPLQLVQPPDGSTIGSITEQAALEALRQHEPASTKEIYEAIHDAVPIGGKNPHSTLSARLSMSRRIKRGRGGWWRV